MFRECTRLEGCVSAGGRDEETTMTPTITPIPDTTFGAVVTDVDLAALDDELWQVIEDAFIEHAALVFPGQFPSPEVQHAFALRFGEIEYLRDGDQAVVQITNVGPDGKVFAPSGLRRRDNGENGGA